MVKTLSAGADFGKDDKVYLSIEFLPLSKHLLLYSRSEALVCVTLGTCRRKTPIITAFSRGS